MSKLTINLTGQAVKEESSQGFDPIPDGDYKATIFDVVPGEYASEANKGRPKFDVQFRIAEGEYLNRRLFTHIPLFTVWGPTKKNPDGADAFAFYDFFGPVQGKTPKEFRAEVKDIVENGDGQLDLPTPGDLLGKELVITVKKRKDPWAYQRALETNPDAKPEDFERNEISAYTVPSKAEAKTGSVGKFKL